MTFTQLITTDNYAIIYHKIKQHIHDIILDNNRAKQFVTLIQEIVFENKTPQQPKQVYQN